MSTSPDLWLFATLVFGVVLLPGMDMAFVAGSSMTSGLRSGLAAVAGIMVAGQVHLAAGIGGMVALSQWWPGAQQTMLLAGAAYMGWIGWSIWRSAEAAGPRSSQMVPAGTPGVTPGGWRRTFWRAGATCLMNPKAYAFTLAILPAFIHSPQRSEGAQALWLGGIIAANQGGVYGLVALLAASARPWMLRGDAAQRRLARVVGASLMLGAAATLAQA